MNKTQEMKMRELAEEMARDLKTPEDLSAFSAQLKKIMVEAALGAEMEEHLGYGRHSVDGNNTGNSRNGRTRKNLKGDHGEIEIETPRDRNGTFEPLMVKKGQRRITGMDEQILCLYAKGMTTRDIVDAFEEMYGAEVSATLVSRVTNAVIEQVTQWQERPLDDVYPIVYLDCIVLKIREDKRVVKKSVYLALGVNLEGHKELLGIWIGENEGSKFWLNILTELRMRGVEEILIACVDGLTGFPEAIEVEYPKAKVQLCIVHMVRNSLKYVTWKDYKQVTTDLKKIYRSKTEEEALRELENFGKTWDKKYPNISRSWHRNWANLITIFDYPDDIRKVICTTNSIEAVHRQFRKLTKTKGGFPNDNSLLKLLYMGIKNAQKKWTMPIQNWNLTLSQLAIFFEGRLDGALDL